MSDSSKSSKWGGYCSSDYSGSSSGGDGDGAEAADADEDEDIEQQSLEDAETASGNRSSAARTMNWLIFAGAAAAVTSAVVAVAMRKRVSPRCCLCFHISTIYLLVD